MSTSNNKTKMPKLDSAQELSLSVKMGSSAEMSGVVCMDQETMALWRPLQNQPQSNDAPEIEQSKSVAEASASALDAEGEPEQSTFAVAASATSAGVPTQKKKQVSVPEWSKFLSGPNFESVCCLR